MQVDFISKKICSLASEIDLGWRVLNFLEESFRIQVRNDDSLYQELEQREACH